MVEKEINKKNKVIKEKEFDLISLTNERRSTFGGGRRRNQSENSLFDEDEDDVFGLILSNVHTNVRNIKKIFKNSSFKEFKPLSGIFKNIQMDLKSMKRKIKKKKKKKNSALISGNINLEFDEYPDGFDYVEDFTNGKELLKKVQKTVSKNLKNIQNKHLQNKIILYKTLNVPVMLKPVVKAPMQKALSKIRRLIGDTRMTISIGYLIRDPKHSIRFGDYVVHFMNEEEFDKAARSKKGGVYKAFKNKEDFSEKLFSIHKYWNKHVASNGQIVRNNGRNIGEDNGNGISFQNIFS